MKRSDFTEKENQLIRRIEHEHDFFKYKILSMQRKKIYEECNHIRFVECVYEYLIYNEDIKEEYLNAVSKCRGNIFEELYRVYLDYEYATVGTWEEVDNFMELLIKEQKKWYEVLRREVS